MLMSDAEGAIQTLLILVYAREQSHGSLRIYTDTKCCTTRTRKAPTVHAACVCPSTYIWERDDKDAEILIKPPSF